MRSDVYCTNCAGKFIATLDLDLNGNHEITCPLCQHVHYRVVKDGVVTEDRWRSSAVAGMPTFVASTSTITNVNFYNVAYSVGTNVTSNGYTSDLWLQRTDLNV
jgi:hypothetical protein